jgi:hypothetical protein
MGGRKHSARGLLLKALFDGPGTFDELAARIGTMPPSGPNRHFVPATPERLRAAMWYVHRRLEGSQPFPCCTRRRKSILDLSGDGKNAAAPSGDRQANLARSVLNIDALNESFESLTFRANSHASNASPRAAEG